MEGWLRTLKQNYGIHVSTPVEPDVIAEITLAPTESDGRLSSISSGEYRGVLGVGAQHFSVRWFVPTSSALVPCGRSGTFGVQFLVPEAALPYFQLGTSFSVWEGRDIGSGVVLRVLAHS